jgi:hypothetical protein
MRASRAAMAALGLLAACSEQASLNCPSGTASVGQFTLSFAGQHSSGECIATSADGGDAGIGPVTLDDGGQSGSNLCFGAGPDGGPELTLILQTTTRTAPLVDGGFLFSGADDGGTNGTGCVCGVAIVETFAGSLAGSAADGGIDLPADGGPPLVTGLSGTLMDVLTPVDAGDPTCTCTMPCTVTYGISGAL